MKRCWQFSTAWILSLLICTMVFPCFPAVGAYHHFGIAPSDVPEIIVRSAWHYPITLQNYKTGIIHHLDTDSLDGIVAMPSFHACASVILGWGFWHIPLLRYPFIVVDAAMWASSVPIGGHYAVDVLAGSAVAVLAISVSSRLISPP